MGGACSPDDLVCILLAAGSFYDNGRVVSSVRKCIMCVSYPPMTQFPSAAVVKSDVKDNPAGKADDIAFANLSLCPHFLFSQHVKVRTKI